MRNPTFRTAAAAALAATIAIGGAAAVSAQSPVPATSMTPVDITVAVVPKAVTIPFFDLVHTGADEAAAEIGGTVLYNGPTTPSGPEQIPFVSQFADQQVACIAIAGDDPNAVAPALKQAIANGTKVVSYDSDVAADARQIFIGDATDDDIARTQIQMLGEQMGFAGEFAILSTTPTTTNQNTWIEIMKDELTKPEYAGMTLVQTAYGEGQVDKAAIATQGLLTGFPNLKGIVAPDVPAGVGAAQEIAKAGMSGKIALTGLFLPSLMTDFVHDGTVKEFILYNPADLGYLTYLTCAALASGAVTGAEGDVDYAAGRLGERTVDANHVIILGPPTKFNIDNIDTAGY